MEDFFEIGELINPQGIGSLAIPRAKQAAIAIEKNKNFQLIELRWEIKINNRIEIIVVEICCDGIPAKSNSGLQYRERLALCFSQDNEIIPEVRALRKSFPFKLHVSQNGADQPLGLCLFFESWRDVKRIWTPEYHLKRIIWWMENSAMDTLHPVDQPLEQVYFSTGDELILPSDFPEKFEELEKEILIFAATPRKSANLTLFADFSSRLPQGKFLDVDCIIVSLPPSAHTYVGQIPSKLSMLNELFKTRGVDFEDIFIKKLRERFKTGGKEERPKDLDQINSILLLCIPVCRYEGGPIEKYMINALASKKSLLKIAEAAKVLVWSIDRYILNQDFATGFLPTSEKWLETAVYPLEVLFHLNKKMAREISGISTPGPNGVIIGMGALGSKVHEIWMRSGWGNWDFADSDHLRPHNIARHAATPEYLGLNKANVAKILLQRFFPTETHETKVFTNFIEAHGDAQTQSTLETTDIVIDFTASLSYPRDHGANPAFPRGISAFFTPDGKNSVIISEDAARTLTLDTLEAQYYRLLISEKEDSFFRSENTRTFSSGVTCRDISLIIPASNISIHSSLIAQQIPQICAMDEAVIKVFHLDEITGSIEVKTLKPAKAKRTTLDAFTVFWDSIVIDKVRAMRKTNLPTETGGILVGYIDFVLRSIFVVDVSDAPSDSQKEINAFGRGVIGLEEFVNRARDRSGEVLQYIGEWHSHPAESSSIASPSDFLQMAHLANALAEDGAPALMLIVGESEESWYLCQENSIPKT